MKTDSIYEDGTYLSENPSWHIEDSYWKSNQIIRMLKKNRINPATICEVGCGAGEILNRLYSELDNDVILSGYEISPQAYDICKKKEKGNLKYFLKDFLTEKDLTYDLLLLIDVFEHIEDYFNFLRDLRTKATYKIFHIPLDLSVQSVLRSSPLIYARTKVGHIHYFTKDTALATLRDAGYEILDYFYTSGSVELPNRGWKATLLKLPRKLFFSVNQELTARVLGGFSLLVLAK